MQEILLEIHFGKKTNIIKNCQKQEPLLLWSNKQCVLANRAISEGKQMR